MFIFWAFLRVDDREILTVKRGSLRVNKESRWRTLGSAADAKLDFRRKKTPRLLAVVPRIPKGSLRGCDRL